jgi:hypothetical protein
MGAHPSRRRGQWARSLLRGRGDNIAVAGKRQVQLRLSSAPRTAAKRPNGAMRLHHLSDWYPSEVGPYVERMRTEDIATVAAKAYEVVESE